MRSFPDLTPPMIFTRFDRWVGRGYDFAMLYLLFFFFTVLPLLELAILIYIGSKTSVLFTIGLILVAGMAGALLARWQGWRTLAKIQAEARGGRMPSESLFDGFLILVAGIFLVAPGVLTDLLGFSLLLPPVRKIVKRWIRKWIETRLRRGELQMRSAFWEDHASVPPNDFIEIRTLGPPPRQTEP